MSFSTWSELAARMRDDYASGSWRTKSYEGDSGRMEYFSPAEFLQALAYAESRAAEEQAGTGGYGVRTCARAADR